MIEDDNNKDESDQVKKLNNFSSAVVFNPREYILCLSLIFSGLYSKEHFTKEHRDMLFCISKKLKVRLNEQLTKIVEARGIKDNERIQEEIEKEEERIFDELFPEITPDEIKDRIENNSLSH